MQIVKPQVYLIGRPELNDPGMHRFLDDHQVSEWETDSLNSAEILPELAGRLCYMSFSKPRPGGNSAYLGHIKEVGHGSVFEHSVWNFIITGVSRSFTHELVRHRAGFGYCLAPETLIHCGEDGSELVTIEALYRRYQTNRKIAATTGEPIKPIELRTWNEFEGKFEVGRVKQIVCSGKKLIRGIRMNNGNSIRSSPNHQFLTNKGWLSLTGIGESGFSCDGNEVKLAADNESGISFKPLKAWIILGQHVTYDIEMEHPHYNFVANGIITHNSQLSQRYVDESVVNFVEPDCISEDPTLHQAWTEAVQTTQEAYIKLVEGLNTKFSGVEDKTLRRKMARQAARSVLPNATETKIFVTANARSWRHFIELRCNEHAEVEIREVAAQILEILQKEAPNLFNDYHFITLPDGSRAAVTNFKKV